MSFERFQGVVEVDNTYLNSSLKVKLQLVENCPLSVRNVLVSKDSCIRASDVRTRNLKEADIGKLTFFGFEKPRIVHLPNINFIQVQSNPSFSVGLCLAKVLVLCLKDTDEFREAAINGIQFFHDQLQRIQGVDLIVKNMHELRLFTIFLEGVPNDVLDSFIQQLLSLPLFVYLKAEIAKIDDSAAQELFSATQHRYLTIDTCFFIIREMKWLVTPSEEDFVEVPLEECLNVVVYNVPRLGVDSIHLMPQLGTSSMVNEMCLEELVAQDFKVYVTFNERGNYFAVTQMERKKYNDLCRRECEFYSIPIQDYRAAREEQLLQFWDIVEHFNTRKANEPDIKFVMHCTSGNGRSTWMLISYLMKKMVDKEGKDVVLGPIIQAFKVIYDLCATTEEKKEESMFDEPFFLKSSKSCPNALKQFEQEYTLRMAEMYTSNLLTQAIRNTATIRRIRAIIEEVNYKAEDEVFLEFEQEGEDMSFLFLNWIFTIVKTILHSESASSEPSRKRRK